MRVCSPSCHASCSKESSKAIASPATMSRVSSATRSLEPSVPTRGKCSRSFLFVGPQCFVMCVSGCSKIRHFECKHHHLKYKNRIRTHQSHWMETINHIEWKWGYRQRWEEGVTICAARWNGRAQQLHRLRACSQKQSYNKPKTQRESLSKNGRETVKDSRQTVKIVRKSFENRTSRGVFVGELRNSSLLMRNFSFQMHNPLFLIRNSSFSWCKIHHFYWPQRRRAAAGRKCSNCPDLRESEKRLWKRVEKRLQNIGKNGCYENGYENG